MRTVHLLNLPANNDDFRMRYTSGEGFEIELKTLGVEVKINKIVKDKKTEDGKDIYVLYNTLFIPYSNIVGIEELAEKEV